MRKLTLNEFKEKSNHVHNFKYNYDKSIYINAITKIEIICYLHGSFFQNPNDHISDRNGCPKCKSEKIGNLKRKSIDILIKSFNKIHNFKYNYDKIEYKNNQSKIIITCHDHGDFQQSAGKHLLGQGCPICHNYFSSGELKVKEYLDSLQIKYEQQKWFAELKGDFRVLKFDFYIPDENYIIEYDGEFHFNYKKIFGYRYMDEDEALEKFLKIKEYDVIKDNFCRKNNIQLLRIPYNIYSYKRISQTIGEFLDRHGFFNG